MNTAEILMGRIEDGKLPPRKATLIVAVSGGVDSVALTHLLIRLSAKYEWRLILAYFNHRLRRAATADENWVRALAGRLGVRVVVGGGAIKQLAKQKKMTIEEAGRMARYKFLEQVAKRYRAMAIVTGHTMDDQAETVAMNWLRGSGVRGLAGMRIWEGKLWRPLLRVTKAELKALAKTLQFGHREDATNRKLVHTRNRIRHQLMPMLKKFNPQIQEALARNAESLGELEELVEAWLNQAKKLVKVRRASGGISWQFAPFKKLPIYLQNELLLWAMRDLNQGNLGYKAAHLAEMHKALDSRSPRSFKQLPGKLFLIKAYDKISVSRFKPTSK